MAKAASSKAERGGDEGRTLEPKQPKRKAAPAGDGAPAEGGAPKERAQKPSKKRRLSAKSAAAREVTDDDVEADDAPAAPRGNPASHTVFVGQLSFGTSAEQLQQHFESTPGMSAGVTVRLLTQKGSNKPKGTAFVQLTSESDVHTALRVLHKSMLDGRRINVERTVGGGGKGTPRLEKLKSLREMQDGARARRVQQLIESVIEEHASGGADELDEPETMGLSTDDTDERVREFLGTLAEDVARAALLDFASSPVVPGVKNRCAYLMGVLKRYVEEHTADSKQRAASAGGAHGRSRSAGGGAERRRGGGRGGGRGSERGGGGGRGRGGGRGGGGRGRSGRGGGRRGGS